MSRTKIAALSLGLALASPLAAQAATDPEGLTGLLDGTFAYSRIPVGKIAVDSDQYTVHGAALYTFDNPGFGVQIEGQDDFYFAVKYNLAHLWSAGGSLFWRDNKGTFGVSASYFSVDAPAAPLFSGKKSIQSFGFFGEYYAFNELTLQVKGGGTTGGVGYASLYTAGGLTWYESPALAFHMEINFTAFTSAHDWTDVNSSIEYLPFHSVPLSFFAGYDYANVSSARYASTFFAGIKYHFGSGLVLADYQRTGPIEWTGNAQPGANLKF